jgi:hypothetical protein
MKSIDDYFNDPRMIELKDAPFPVQEVYAWRFAVQDQTQGMTPEQTKAYYKEVRRSTDEFCAKHGIHLKYLETQD